MNKVYEYYKQVAGAFGPSGREDSVRETLAGLAAPFLDDITTDALGNLICRKKGKDGGKKVMLAAHMDSIGVVVTFIDEKGFLRFGAVGGLFTGDLIDIQVQFENGVKGVISFEEKTPFRSIDQSNLFIDIGAKNREEAEKLVRVGDFAVFHAPAFTQGDVLCGPYLDNRIGCVALLLAMEQLPDDLPNDVYFVFTCQEEVGLRGAGSAAFAIQPELAIAVDVTDTGDCPERKLPMAVKLGAGPAVKVMDRSVISAPQVRDKLLETADRLSIPVQREIMLLGGTDTSAIQKSAGGILAGGLSIPTRYIHSPAEMCAISDVENTARLLAETVCTFLRKMRSE